MNQRELSILIHLIQNVNRYLTYEELSTFFNLPISAIRNGIDGIDIELNKEGLSQIIRKPRHGIKVDVRELEKLNRLVIDERKSVDSIDFQLAEIRQAFILFSILCSEEKVTIDNLAEISNVSRRTIQNDMKALKDQLEVSSCTIVYEKGAYVVQGNPVSVRTLIVNKLKECMVSADEYELVTLFNSFYSLIIGLNSNEENIGQIYEFLLTVMPVSYTTLSTLYVLVYVMSLTCYTSNTNNEHLENSEEVLLEESALFELSKIIINEIQVITGRDVNFYEAYYLTIVLHTLPVTNYAEFEAIYPLEIELLVHQLIEKVSSAMHFPFYDDKELEKFIINHTVPTIQRVKFDNQIHNPLSSLIKQKYTALHDAIKLSLHLIERYIGGVLNDDEVSFYTLYFASSMEKLESKKHPKNVLVVCNSGNAVSRLIQYKLNKEFDLHILDFVSGNSLEAKINEYKPDLVISVITQKHQVINGVPVIVVSPLLTDTDIFNLKTYLNVVEDPLFDRADLHECNLLKFLTPEMFMIDAEVDNHDALIRLSGNLLEKGGCVNSSYADEMIDVTRKFGSLGHFLIAPNIILPHAGISDNVKKIGFSFVRLKNPIIVNDNSISIAIAMCTTDKEGHKQSVMELGKLFNDEDFLSKVLTVNSYREFSELIQISLRKEN